MDEILVSGRGMEGVGRGELGKDDGYISNVESSHGYAHTHRTRSNQGLGDHVVSCLDV
jgi:hypothetical protein